MIQRKPKEGRKKVKKRIRRTSYFDVVDIVADGSIGSPLQANGLQVPVLVLDTSQRQDLDDVFHAHSFEHLNNGDVRTIWSSQTNGNWVGLEINFERPVETRAIIRFSVPHYSALVHLALSSQAVIIHPGQPGSKFKDVHFPEESDGSQTPKQGGLFLNVPHGGFEQVWEKMYRKQLFKYFKKEMKCSDQKAKELADAQYSAVNELSNIQLPSLSESDEPIKILYADTDDSDELN